MDLKLGVYLLFLKKNNQEKKKIKRILSSLSYISYVDGQGNRQSKLLLVNLIGRKNSIIFIKVIPYSLVISLGKSSFGIKVVDIVHTLCVCYVLTEYWVDEMPFCPPIHIYYTNKTIIKFFLKY